MTKEQHAQIAAQLIVLVALPARLCGAVVREVKDLYEEADEAEAAYRLWRDACGNQFNGEDLAQVESTVKEAFMRAYLDARSAQ